MKTPSLGIGIALFFCMPLLADDNTRESITYVDLQAKANHKLTDTYPSKRFVDNDLKELPRGKQKFSDLPFLIGESFIVLGSKQLPTMPEHVKGIAIGTKAKRIHVLHASAYDTPGNTIVGKYVLNYDDKSVETLELHYRKEILSWWASPTAPVATSAKLAWTGSNQAAVDNGMVLRLYVQTWKNPKPDKTIATIDFISSQTDCAPFCVAITLDRE